MSDRRVTISILVATVLGLVGWDIYVAAKAPKGSTISEVTYKAASEHPVLPFAIGVLCGHLLWAQRIKDEEELKK